MTPQKGELALDALIAITVRAGINQPVTDAEIEQHMSNPHLTPEETRAFDAWKETCVSRVLGKLSQAQPGEENSEVEHELYAAMNRKNETDRHDEKTEEELKRLRKELLGEEDEQ